MTYATHLSDVPPAETNRRSRRRSLAAGATAVLSLGVTALVAPLVAATPAGAAVPFEVQSLDGRGNNRANPTWGLAGTNYARVAPARYADGRGTPVAGPNSRYVSNRLFNDTHQNLFSQREVSQWGFVWGQFLDHTFGLRDEAGTVANIPFDNADPMDGFRNSLGVIPFTRSAVAPGTGVTNARQQSNTVSSFIDAWAVYGGTDARLEWLREGPVDGNLANNGARLLLPSNYLPRRDSRGNPATAPVMAADGHLRRTPNRAMVAGDVRANENIALTATHTLFAREHNRIVGLLPGTLSEEDKFQIARRVVIAEQQYITYEEFLPALGVRLPAYRGYNATINPTLSNEFASVGYRAHSMIHGEFEMESAVSRYTTAELDALRAQGVEITVAGADLELAVPLNVAFFNPDLVPALQLGPLVHGLGLEAEYRNDEQIDNQLRSVLFQVPVGGNPGCLDGAGLPECFDGVLDIGAIDVERGRDHGMPSYNDLRAAYGLPRRPSFQAITGESTDAFPADPELTPGRESDDPDSVDVVGLTDLFGSAVALDSEAAEGTPVQGARRTPLAARMRAVYGTVDRLDAFTGMLAEPHLPNADMGELQLAIWRRQFQELRDGDRFFYGADPGLTAIRQQYGIDFRRTLGDVIAANTDIPTTELAPNVFFVGGRVPPASCRVSYRVSSQWNGHFNGAMTVTNTGDTALNGWMLRFTMPDGQVVEQTWAGFAAQEGANVPLSNESWNGRLAANGGRFDGIGFTASWNNVRNGRPSRITLNTTPCTVTA